MIKCKVDLQKFGLILVSIFAVVFFAFSYDKYYFPAEEHHHYIYINVTKAIFSTDNEFLSVGLDTSFMEKSFHKLNYSDWELLAKFAKSLSPAYLRLGGTAADRVLFNFIDVHQGNERNEHQFNPNDSFIAGDYLKISGHDWLEFNDFVEKSGLRLLFDLNVLLRNGSHWDSHNAEELLSFSNAHDIQMDFQLGNEPNAFQHVFNTCISGAQLGEDFETLRNILSNTHKFNSSMLIGPDVTRPQHLEESSVQYLKDFLANVNNLSAVSWHQYYLNGRTATLKDFMDPEIFDLLSKQINAVEEVVKGFSNFLDVPIWLSETGSAYGGGAPGLSDRYVASFLWLDKLGLAARMGVKVVIRQSLYQGHYSLIDDSMSPLPDFWVSLIYKVLVGRKVLQIKFPRQEEESNLRLYCHCLKKNENISGNVVLFGMNLMNRTEVIIPGGLNTHNPVTSLVLTPENLNLTSKSVLLNGRRLEFNGIEIDIADYFPSASEKIPLKMPPYSLAFWIFHGQREGACLDE